ncbi:MAG: helix-turn-helix domain-containing protein [Acidimicrobiales bacterium]
MSACGCPLEQQAPLIAGCVRAVLDNWPAGVSTTKRWELTELLRLAERAAFAHESEADVEGLAAPPSRAMRLVSAKEVAERVGRSQQAVTAWCRQGRMPAVRIGRQWVVLEHDETPAETRQSEEATRG